MLLLGSFFVVLPSRCLIIFAGELRVLTSALRLLPRGRVVTVLSELISGDPVQCSDYVGPSGHPDPSANLPSLLC